MYSNPTTYGLENAGRPYSNDRSNSSDMLRHEIGSVAPGMRTVERVNMIV